MRTRRLRGALLLLAAWLLGSVGCGGAAANTSAIIQSALATITAEPPEATHTPPASTDIPPAPPPQPATAPPHPTATLTPTVPPAATPSLAVPSPTAIPATEPIIIGNSAGGRPIDGYRFGSGSTSIVLVGGIHGAYERNSISLAQEFIDHFRAYGTEIPAEVSLYVVPNANPDGLAAMDGQETVDDSAGSLQPTGVITGTLVGRFNANGVDLNRNWDCRWSETAYWRDQPVSAGAYPFSEPETDSLRRFLLAVDPAVVIFIHSAAGAVYASGCPEPDPASAELAAIYGLAAGYPVYLSFDHYTITGDAGDWLTTQGIPSFTVELTTHEATDRDQNMAGLQALLESYQAGQESNHEQ